MSNPKLDAKSDPYSLGLASWLWVGSESEVLIGLHQIIFHTDIAYKVYNDTKKGLKIAELNEDQYYATVLLHICKISFFPSICYALLHNISVHFH